MRKSLCVLLTISLMISLAVPTFAQEDNEPKFGTIQVEYTDAPGKLEKLDVLVYDNYVYVDADVISERLGFSFSQADDWISIYAPVSFFEHTVPMLAVHFRLDDTRVCYNPLFGMEYEYEAPCPTIQNDRGVWVPLRYTLDLLGGGSNQLGDVLRIQLPSENVLSVAAMIANYYDAVSFDWTKDFGYTEGWDTVADGAARLVTLLDGLLEFDYSSWCIFAHWTAFDVKFGRTLTTMLCTKEDEEFKKEIEQVEDILDILNPDSTLGKLLRQKQISLDTDVGEWNAVCEECMKRVEDGAGSTVMYNRLYEQLETALDRQNLFSSLGGDALIYSQEALSNATNVLDVAAKIGTVVTYYQEFQDADSFTVSALWDYLYTQTKTDEISHAMKIAMMGHATALQTDGTLYSATRFIEDNLMEILVDEAGLDTMLGLPANIVLMAWDIASDTIPFYDGGLKAVEKREISNYAQKMQNDAMENCKSILSGMQSGEIPLNSQECMRLAEYCYVFLKACYIARSSAVDSLDLENKDEDFLDAVAGKLGDADDTNDRIAYYLSILSQANEQNKGMILGFLPENSEQYLNGYSDDVLLDKVDYSNSVLDTYESFRSVIESIQNSINYNSYADLQKDYCRGAFFDLDGRNILVLMYYALSGSERTPGYYVGLWAENSDGTISCLTDQCIKEIGNSDDAYVTVNIRKIDEKMYMNPYIRTINNSTDISQSQYYRIGDIVVLEYSLYSEETFVPMGDGLVQQDESKSGYYLNEEKIDLSAFYSMQDKLNVGTCILSLCPNWAEGRPPEGNTFDELIEHLLKEATSDDTAIDNFLVAELGFSEDYAQAITDIYVPFCKTLSDTYMASDGSVAKQRSCLVVEFEKGSPNLVIHYWIPDAYSPGQFCETWIIYTIKSGEVVELYCDENYAPTRRAINMVYDDAYGFALREEQTGGYYELIIHYPAAVTNTAMYENYNYIQLSEDSKVLRVWALSGNYVDINF